MRKEIICLLCLFILVGCSKEQPPVSPALISQPSVTVEKVIEPTETALPTDTATVTLTSEPLSTSTPTLTLVPSATPDLRIFGETDYGFTYVRTGPGSVYPVILTIGSDLMIEIIAQSEDEEWVQIDLDFGQVGWIFAADLTIEADYSHLAFVEAPPTPEPTATPEPRAEIAFWIVKDWTYGGYIKNFIPGETVTYVATNLSNGLSGEEIAVLYGSHSRITEENYEYVSLQLVVRDGYKNKSGDVIRIELIGDLGSYVSTTIVLP